MIEAVSTPTANHVVHYEILDAALNEVGHGTCWSGEVDSIELAEGQTLRIQTPAVPHDPSSVIVGYGLARAQHYPSVEEQLGAIWKYLATVDQKKMPVETKEMLAKIQGVKAIFEKGAFYGSGDGSSPVSGARLTRIEV